MTRVESYASLSAAGPVGRAPWARPEPVVQEPVADALSRRATSSASRASWRATQHERGGPVTAVARS